MFVAGREFAAASTSELRGWVPSAEAVAQAAGSGWGVSEQTAALLVRAIEETD